MIRLLLSTLTVVALVTCLLVAGCEKPVEIHARVFDTQKRPIPGAIVYCEAWQYNDGAYDYVWGIADSTGTVNSVNARPMILRWQSGAKLGVAVMAPGKRTFAVNDYTGALTPDNLEFIMNDTTGQIMAWEPKLAKLSFPFESHPALADRLRDPANLLLLHRFADAYSVLEGGTISATSEERAKLDFLAKLQIELTEE